MATKDQRRYEKRKAGGVCVKCNGVKDILTSLTCSQCYNAKKYKEKINILNGRCPCGQLIEKGRSCRECKNKRREYSDKRLQATKELGICYSCDKSQLPNRMNCEEHTLKMIARINCGGMFNWIYIKNLLINQENKCKYCEIDIIIGNNAEVDHIQSKTRFPELKYESSNWQWLCSICNHAKSNMTEEEFFSWLERIFQAI